MPKATTEADIMALKALRMCEHMRASGERGLWAVEEDSPGGAEKNASEDDNASYCQVEGV